MSHFTYRTRDGMGRWNLVHILAISLDAALCIVQSRNIAFRDLH